MADIDKKTVGITSLITAGLILASMVIPGFFDEPKYYCESESSIMGCPGGLSGGSATRCYLNEDKTSWDYCKGGWVQVSDDRPIQEEPEDPNIPPSASGAKKWRCSIDGCVAI